MKISNKTGVFLKYLIAFLVATGLFFLVISVRNIYSETDKQQIFRSLSDGFAIPGVLYLSLGALVWFSNLGSFDGIGYVLKNALLMLIPLSKKKHQTYAQYLETRKRVSGFMFFFIIGGVFLLLGIIFMLLF